MEKREAWMEKPELADGCECAEFLPEDMEFNLSDFALFLSVMKNREAHQSVLSIIMEEPELELVKVHVEEVILNRSGSRAIRLDAMAEDVRSRNFVTEMQNDTVHDDMRKRSRFYQGMLDTPILKSGRETRYRQLPPTVVTFITQDDIFGKDRAKYTFTEQCEEIPGFHLEDGTSKIFLNMTSKNGEPVLVSLLQYMKRTRMDNPELLVPDERICVLDRVVQEVKQSEEWEAVKMSILSIGLERGREQGREQGIEQGMQVLIRTCQEFHESREEIRVRLQERFSLTEELAEAMLEKYWNSGTESRDE